MELMEPARPPLPQRLPGRACGVGVCERLGGFMAGTGPGTCWRDAARGSLRCGVRWWISAWLGSALKNRGVAEEGGEQRQGEALRPAVPPEMGCREPESALPIDPLGAGGGGGTAGGAGVPASSSSPLLLVPSPFLGARIRAHPSRSRAPPPRSPAALICLHQPKPTGLQKELLKSSPKKPAAISTK